MEDLNTHYDDPDAPMIPIDEDREEPDNPNPDPVEPEPEDPGDEPAEPSTGIKKQKITVTGIEDGVSWQAIPNQTWLKVTDIVSGAAEDSFYVSVDANNAGESRTGIVTVIPSDNGANGTVNVYQQGAVLYTLSISPTTMSHDYSSVDIAIIITSNTSWTISCPSWVSLERTSGTGDAMVVGWLSESPNTNRRAGTITVSTTQGGLTATCDVTQEGQPADRTVFTLRNALTHSVEVVLAFGATDQIIPLDRWPAHVLSGYGGQKVIMWNGMDNFLAANVESNTPGSMVYMGVGQHVYVYARVENEYTWELKGLFTVGDSYFEIGNGVNVY
jgi:hypothetical protein